jgi:hypothetical protein
MRTRAGGQLTRLLRGLAGCVGAATRERSTIAETDNEKWHCVVARASLESTQVDLYPRLVDPMWFFADASHMNRRSIETVVFALFVVGVLANPCGAQTPLPAPTPPLVQNQAVQPPQATPSVGVSGQANVGPTSVPTPGVGSTTSSSLGKSFGSAGQGLPGMPGGPPINGAIGSQDPSSQYMRPPVIPPLSCDPAVNIPC